MKVKLKKAEAVLLSPKLTWMKEGTLVKKPRTVDPAAVTKLISDGKEGVKWDMYKIHTKYYAISREHQDVWFVAEAR